MANLGLGSQVIEPDAAVIASIDAQLKQQFSVFRITSAFHFLFIQLSKDMGIGDVV